jgi:hypothetical protein
VFYDSVVSAPWEVILDPEVNKWIVCLEDEIYDRVEAAIDMLSEYGPALGRPLVDTISGSKHSNMKELRVGTCRILFAFDPARNALLLVAGDKRGKWQEWYLESIPVADDRFDTWLHQWKELDQ